MMKLAKAAAVATRLTAWAVAAGALAAGGGGGCGTPGYSTEERFQRIGRNWGYEYEQIQYDVDRIFLLDPAQHLTQWNIQ